MTRTKTLGSKLLVFLLAFAVVFSYSVMPVNQAYAASKKPGKVTISKVTPVSSSAIKVTWKKASNAKKYQIYASTKKNKNFKRVATVSSSKRSYTVKKLSKKYLKANTRYYFKVRAVNGSKKGKFSAVRYYKTKKKPAAVKTKTVYVTPEWLNSAMAGQQKGYEKVVVCEVSYGKVSDSYAEGHVPGAINVFSTEVEDATGEPGQYKAYNLLDVKDIRANLIKKGINANTKVVLYDAGGDPCEVGRQAYGYIVAGVKDVKILNGDLKAWKKAGFAAEKKANEPKAKKSFGTAKSHLEYWTSIEDAKAKLDKNDAKYDPNFKLVSIRSEDEWLGKTSGYDYMHKAGEPKGAVWGKGAKTAFDVADFINKSGTVKKLSTIENIWKDCDFKTDDSQHLAFYCGTGWRATVPFLRLYEAGFKNISVYDGGWYEWLMNEDYPVQVGDPASDSVVYATVGDLPEDNKKVIEKPATLGEEPKARTMTIAVDMTDTGRYPAGKVVEVWVPVPQTEEYQTVENYAVKADTAAVADFKTEENSGWNNKMAYFKWDEKADPASRKAVVSFDVKRYAVSRPDAKEDENATIPAEVLKFVSLKSSRVDPENEFVQKYTKEAVGDAKTNLEKAEKIYNWIIDNLERLDVKDVFIGKDGKEVEFKNDTGCGKGNPADLLENFEKYGRWGGHCTDLNSCFVAMCRAAGVPAREMFGIRLNDTSSDGQHCWAEFYVPGEGWTFADPGDVLKEARAQAADRSKEAIDAARKTDAVAAKKKALWLGVDNNRVVLSRGRDVVLEPAQKGEPRNTFGYPYAEVDGVQKDAKGEVIDCTKYKDFKYTITCAEIGAVNFAEMDKASDEWAKYGIKYADLDYTNDYVIDVRPADTEETKYYSEGHIVGSSQFPVPGDYAAVDKDGLKAEYDKAEGKRVVLVCVSGKKLAGNAMQALQEKGADMSKVTYLIGGATGFTAADGVNKAYALNMGVKADGIADGDVLVDLRNDEQYNGGHFKGSLRADVQTGGADKVTADLDAAYNAVPEGKKLVLVCIKGHGLAKQAMAYYQKTGKDLTKITYLIGGATGVSDTIKADTAKWEK